MSIKTMKIFLIASVILNVILLALQIVGIKSIEQENSSAMLDIPDSHATNESITFTNLPGDIHKGQIIKVFNNQYALVAKQSITVQLPDVPKDFITSFSGVLQWDGADNRWEKILVISDTPESSIATKNNPVDMWWTGYRDTDQVPHLLVVDTNGGGSGEGVGKVLVAQDIGLTEWKVEECFEYAYDLSKRKQLPLSNPDCQNVVITSL